MPEGLKRQVVLMLRTSKEERDEIDTEAAHLGLPTGTWARSVLLKAARELRRKRQKET